MTVESRLANCLFDLCSERLQNSLTSKIAHAYGRHLSTDDAIIIRDILKDSGGYTPTTKQHVSDAIDKILRNHEIIHMPKDKYMEKLDEICFHYKICFEKNMEPQKHILNSLSHAIYNFMHDIRISPMSTSSSYMWRQQLYNNLPAAYNVFVGTFLYRYHLLLAEMKQELNSEQYKTAKTLVYVAFNYGNKMTRLMNGKIADFIPSFIHLSMSQATDYMKYHDFTDSQIKVMTLIRDAVPDWIDDNGIIQHTENTDVESKTEEVTFDTIISNADEGKILEIILPGLSHEDVEISEDIDCFILKIKRTTILFDEGEYGFTKKIDDRNEYFIQHAKFENGILELWMLDKSQYVRAINIH